MKHDNLLIDGYTLTIVQGCSFLPEHQHSTGEGVSGELNDPRYS